MTIFGFETDPLALLMLVVAVAVGCVGYFAAFRFGLEEGLRNRRSPNQVKLAALAAGLLLMGAVGSFMTWGVLIFAVIAGLAVLLLLLARGGQKLTLVLFVLAIALAAAALLTHRRHRSHPVPQPAAAGDANRVESSAPAGPPADLEHPAIRPIAPKDDADALIKPPAPPRP